MDGAYMTVQGIRLGRVGPHLFQPGVRISVPTSIALAALSHGYAEPTGNGEVVGRETNDEPPARTRVFRFERTEGGS